MATSASSNGRRRRRLKRNTFLYVQKSGETNKLISISHVAITEAVGLVDWTAHVEITSGEIQTSHITFQVCIPFVLNSSSSSA
jgi:hypothetical protein